MMWNSSEDYYEYKHNIRSNGSNTRRNGNMAQHGSTRVPKQGGTWKLQDEMMQQTRQQANNAKKSHGQGERTTTVRDYNKTEDMPNRKSAIPVDEIIYERAEEAAHQQERQEQEVATESEAETEAQESDVNEGTDDNGEDVSQRSFMDEMFESDGEGEFDDEYVDMPSYDTLLEENAKLNRQLARVIAQYEQLSNDWDSYRKRTKVEAERNKELASERVATQIIPVIDDLWRSIEHLKTMGDDIMPIANGNEAIANRIISALNKEGIEVISPLGEQFDVNRHRAIALQPVEGKPAGIVFHVYQDGYAIGDRVIRPASVGVTK